MSFWDDAGDFVNKTDQNAVSPAGLWQMGSGGGAGIMLPAAAAAGGINMGLGDAFNGLYNNFNPTAAHVGQQDFGPMQEQANSTYGSALNNQNDTLAQQRRFAEALQIQSQGGGPNPGQALMQQGLNQAASQQAGAVANQKGLSPALATRLAAMQGAGVAQGAAGAGAQMQAQQQLNAQNQYGQMTGQIGAMSNQMAQNALNQQQLAQHGIATQNEQSLKSQMAQNAMLSAQAQANAGTNSKLLGGLLGGAGSLLPLLLSDGGNVPGKPVVGGDDPKNDTVPAMLSPGEIVIPRTASGDPDKAKDFIDHLKGNMKKGKGEEPSYGKLLQAHKSISKRLDEIEKRMKGA